LQFIILLSIIVCSTAQLRINPLVLGTNALAAEQIIPLGPRPLGLRAPLLARPIAAPIAAALPAPLLARPFLADDLAVPTPYTYGFQSADEFGTTLTRQESADGGGVVTGSYGYTDAQGLSRLVEYVADAAGFRASVKTNEPGMTSYLNSFLLYNSFSN
jgi:hypothetical protein